MITKKMQDLLNKQINLELYSAYLYLDMANYYSDQGLDGFAHWFEVQTQEEVAHAMLFRTFCLDNEVPITFTAIAGPNLTYKTHKDPLVGALAHEKEITASIHNMMSVALENKDYRTMQILNWFVNEQTEEETNANDNIQKYDLFGDSEGLYSLDTKMAQRIFTPPTIV